MSILLIGLDEEQGPALVERLLDEGDIVGVIEEQGGRADLWRGLGAHVAIGSREDPDLVERAGQHARSIVVFESDPVTAPRALDAILEGARLAPGEAARIIYVADSLGREVAASLSGSAFDYVTLSVRRRGRLMRRGVAVAAGDLAEAVSAADDLRGNPRLELDLLAAEGWRALGLEPR